MSVHSDVVVVDIEDVVVDKPKAKRARVAAKDTPVLPPIFTAEEVADIRKELVTWYKANRRKLPWRGDPPPYKSTAAVDGKPAAAKNREGKADERTPGEDLTAAIIKEESDKHLPEPALAMTPSSELERASAGAVCLPQAARQITAEVSVPSAEGSEEVTELRLNNPYGTWVSEIMLQQTRVDTVIDYYLKWMERFPTVTALAEASQDEVNKYWAGLGYYRRAANLRLGAQHVVEKFGGLLPRDVEGLKSIPGIGDYTAGAIASIAYSLPVPLVDGNVVRVISRLRAWEQDAKSPGLAKDCWRAAAELVDPVSPGDFNQALMELGAMVCVPSAGPRCEVCPLRTSGSCRGFAEAQRLAPIIHHGPAAAKSMGRKKLGSANVAKQADGSGSLLKYFVSKREESTEPIATLLPEATQAPPLERYADISAYIAAKYPAKPAPKTVLTEKLAACILQVGSRICLIKETETTKSTAPKANKRQRPPPSEGETLEEEEEAILGGALLSGQWHPFTVSLDAEPEDRALLQGIREQTSLRLLQPHLETSISAADDDGIGIDVRICFRNRWEGIKHVFSHRTHLINVHLLQAEEGGSNPTAEDIIQAISNSSKGRLAAKLVEPSEIEGLGITTWLRKILEAAGVLTPKKST